MSGLWHGQSRLPTEVHRSGLLASRWTSVGLGQSQGYEERQPHAHVGVFGQSTMDVSRLFLPELRVARLLPQLQSRRQLWGTWKQWRWQSCKEAGSASDFRDYLSAECERLRGGDSLSSEATAVEDSGPAKAEEQDRLKALDASIANLEKARGGKPDVAIDEVLRQKRLERQELKDQMQSRKSTKALLKAAIAAREQAVLKLEGLQKEEMDLTQLLLLKQQEISDAKSEAAEKAREVETLQARRLAEVDCEGSVSHVSSSASCSAPLSPQHWALGLAASLPEDVRVKFEEWYSSVEIEAKASVDPYPEVLSQGSPATSDSSGSCLVDTHCCDIYRFRLPCGQGSFPLSARNAICCGVSGEQESGAAAGGRSVRECRRPAVAGCRR